MKKIIFLIILFTQSICLFATIQISDIIIYNGNEYRLIVSHPMESYFIESPEKRPPSGDISALWRGYIATFEIIDNELWVIDIKTPNGNYSIINGNFIIGYTSIVKECFEGKDRLKMDWYNGFLVIPQGEIIDYELLGWNADYENYLIIEIQNGNIINKFTLSFLQYAEFFENQLKERYWEMFRIWNNINFPKR